MTVSEYINEYIEKYTTYKNYWCYEDAYVLLGGIAMYEATNDARYADFVVGFLEQTLDDSGKILNFPNDLRLDSFCGGRVLLFAHRYMGLEKYRFAAQSLVQKLSTHPRCANGAPWHKDIYPNQLWLDGLYMLLPFCAEYGALSDAELLRQINNVRELMFDTHKKLFYHGYDESRAASWADKRTGLSGAFWLRGEGWLLSALADIAAVKTQCARYAELLHEALCGILQYRDERTGMFFQVIDMPKLAGNYVETSGSLMVAYSLIKGAESGVLDEKCGDIGADIFECVIRNKLIGGSLRDICLSAGLGGSENRSGTAEYYVGELRTADDAKGVGALMQAYSQKLLWEKRRRV